VIQITLQESSNYRNEERVNTINKLTSKRKIFKNLKNNSIKISETDGKVENRIMEEVVAELHIPNLDIEHTELDVIHGSIR